MSLFFHSENRAFNLFHNSIESLLINIPSTNLQCSSFITSMSWSTHLPWTNTNVSSANVIANKFEETLYTYQVHVKETKTGPTLTPYDMHGLVIMVRIWNILIATGSEIHSQSNFVMWCSGHTVYKKVRVRSSSPSLNSFAHGLLIDLTRCLCYHGMISNARHIRGYKLFAAPSHSLRRDISVYMYIYEARYGLYSCPHMLIPYIITLGVFN